jgi:hypothetical protein
LPVKKWKAIANNIVGAIALSTHLQRQLKQYLHCPIHVIKHAIAPAYSHWSMLAWRAGGKCVAQFGNYGRNVRAIFQLPPHPQYRYARYRVESKMYRQHERIAAAYYRDKRTEHQGVFDNTAVPNELYHDLLCSSVVFMEVLAGSANNVILECIVRSTPVLVNRYAAVVEYLDEDYPLYYNDLDHARTLLTDENIAAAHEYLLRMPKDEFTAAAFVSGLLHAVGVHNATSK